MAKGDGFKAFFGGLLSNAVWEALKTAVGGGLMSSLIIGSVSYVRHRTIDWWGLLFLGGSTAVVWFILLRFPRQELASSRENVLLRVNPSNDEQVRRLNAAHQDELRRHEAQLKSDLFRAEQRGKMCDEELKRCKDDLADSANRNLEYRAQLAIFSKLQLDALQLSNDLMDYLIRMGQPPTPKYSLDDIHRLSVAESRRLIETDDGDYEDSVYFHFGDSHDQPRAHTTDALANGITTRIRRLAPFYDKLKAGYELEFAARVKELSHRFTLDDLSDSRLSQSISGRTTSATIKSIAEALWELAYKVAERNVPAEKAERA